MALKATESEGSDVAKEEMVLITRNIKKFLKKDNNYGKRNITRNLKNSNKAQLVVVSNVKK